MNFSIEKEKDSCLNFLDVNISRESENFAITVYNKKTFIGVFSNFKIFLSETYKTSLIKSFLFWCSSICSDFIKFNHGIDKLKSILYKNSYPYYLVEKYIKGFLSKILVPQTVASTFPKNDLVITVPYLSKFRLQISARINRIMKNELPYCNFWFVFQTKCKLNNFFTFKDKTPSFFCSGIVNKFHLAGCNTTYYGKCKRHFKVHLILKNSQFSLTTTRTLILP